MIDDVNMFGEKPYSEVKFTLWTLLFFGTEYRPPLPPSPNKVYRKNQQNSINKIEDWNSTVSFHVGVIQKLFNKVKRWNTSLQLCSILSIQQYSGIQKSFCIERREWRYDQSSDFPLQGICLLLCGASNSHLSFELIRRERMSQVFYLISCSFFDSVAWPPIANKFVFDVRLPWHNCQMYLLTLHYCSQFSSTVWS